MRFEKPIVCVGPPGAGKTTGFIEILDNLFQKNFAPENIWVLEPTRKIVDFKRRDLSKRLKEKGGYSKVKYINYASGLSDAFYNKIDRTKDIIIIDEPHLLFTSEYRQFDIKTIKEIHELFGSRVIYMTATSEILESYLRYYKIEYIKVAVPARLKRNKINIRLIPSILSKYFSIEKCSDYDILITNNIKNVKKLSLIFGDGDHSYIFSTFAERNNVLFKECEIKDDKWVGTCAMGQGIDKNKTIRQGIGNVLFDANSFRQFPDILKNDYENVYEECKVDEIKKFLAMQYTCMAENAIQADRFRIDLDELNIDVLLNESLPKKAIENGMGEMEFIDIFKEMCLNYFRKVYTNSEINFINIDGLYSGKMQMFTFSDFKKCLVDYDPLHTKNEKSLRERYAELVEFFVNPINETGERMARSYGACRSAILYFSEITNKFYGLEKNERYGALFKGVSTDIKSAYVLQKALNEFIEYIENNDLHIKYRDLVLSKKVEGCRVNSVDELSKIDLDEAFVTYYEQLSYFIESLLMIIISIYGCDYRIMNSKTRQASPLAFLTKALRSLIIKKDIDIKSAHLVAAAKEIVGSENRFCLTSIEKIYTFGNKSKEEVVDYLRTFRKSATLNIKSLSEREICKTVAVWGLNRYDKYKKDNDLEWIAHFLGNMIENVSKEELANRIKNIKNIGYRNGINYEQIWLGEYSRRRGTIFRIMDGLCQVWGDEKLLDEIKNKIEVEHGIALSYEDIKKYNVLGLNNLNVYVMGNQEKIKDLKIINGELEGTEIQDSFNEVLESLEKLRKLYLKGRHKGRAVGKAVGKAKGKAVGRKLSLKQYRVKEAFEVKKSGVRYAAGLYNWAYIPKDIPKHYRIKFIEKTGLSFEYSSGN